MFVLHCCILVVGLFQEILDIIQIRDVKGSDLPGEGFLDDKGAIGSKGTEPDDQRHSQNNQGCLSQDPFGCRQGFRSNAGQSRLQKKTKNKILVDKLFR
jgi:hypothetical protein